MVEKYTIMGDFLHKFLEKVLNVCRNFLLSDKEICEGKVVPNMQILLGNKSLLIHEQKNIFAENKNINREKELILLRKI